MSPSETMPTAAWSAGLHRVYLSASGEVHALRGVDAAFPAGLITVVAGPSGSGKSSLLRLLAGLDRPTAGQVVVGGLDLTQLRDRELRSLRRRHVGFVFQRPSHNLMARLTAREHLEHAVRLRTGGSAPVDNLLDDLGLAATSSRRPHELSGGEQQRLAFAQALIGQPSVLLADEPTAELDSASAQALLAAVCTSSRDGTAVVLSSHDPQVLAVADLVLRLRDGSVESEEVRGGDGGPGRSLAVIDATGRVQLPPHLLARFPQRRARLEPSGDGVLLSPP